MAPWTKGIFSLLQASATICRVIKLSRPLSTTPAFFINLVTVRGWMVLLMAVTLTAELIFLTLPAAALTLDFRRSPSAGESVYRQVDL